MSDLDEAWDRLARPDKELLYKLATGEKTNVAAEEWYVEAGWERADTARAHMVKLHRAGFLVNLHGHRWGIGSAAVREAILRGVERDAQEPVQAKKGGGRLPRDVERVLEQVVGLEGRVTTADEVAGLIRDARACLGARGRRL